jgi:glutathione synthase/RimK-type ligase-like ATP-grasp enzyme
MAILILGGQDDAHAVHMLQHLQGRGADVELFDSRWFPTAMTISFDPATDTGRLRLPSGRVLQFADIEAVYWRCYNMVATPPLADEGQAMIAGNDARSLFESLLIHWKTRWVNGWAAFQLHQTKPAALAMVAALGVPVPRTLLGNDPEAVREFAARVPKVIFKPVQGGAHTLRLTQEHLSDANLRNLAYAPVTLQEEVEGTNIRVFVAGERVLTCEVATVEIDFREDPDPKIIPHTLPAEVEDQCRRAARVLHLTWTGIDLRLTPEGLYIFLEANPSPMFMGFEARSGQPLTDALADLLQGK